VAGSFEPPESRTADLGGPVHYVEWDGPPERTFVLVHGLGGAHLNWVLVGAGLSKLGRVLALDLAGFGRTPRAGRSSKLTANRALLSHFLEEIVGAPVVLAGNSLGGGIAMMQAATEPSSVEGLILTASVYPWARGGFPSPVVIGGFAAYRMKRVGEWVMRQRFERLDADRLVRLSLRLSTVDIRRIPEDVIRAHVDLLLEREDDPDAAPAFLQATRSLLSLGRSPERGRAIVDQVKGPVLAIHGRQDRLVPAAFAWAATNAHPEWWIRVLPDVGHVPQLEAPDRWLANVADWLQHKSSTTEGTVRK
jgi:pimeloyl-ACP methyl ester carboxylesterase